MPVQRVLDDGSFLSVIRPSHVTRAEADQQAITVRVIDAEAHCSRAREHGARIIQEPMTFPYGERQYTAEDIGGHSWTFSQSVVDMLPEDWGGTSVRF